MVIERFDEKIEVRRLTKKNNLKEWCFDVHEDTVVKLFYKDFEGDLDLCDSFFMSKAKTKDVDISFTDNIKHLIGVEKNIVKDLSFELYQSVLLVSFIKKKKAYQYAIDIINTDRVIIFNSKENTHFELDRCGSRADAGNIYLRDIYVTTVKNLSAILNNQKCSVKHF